MQTPALIPTKSLVPPGRMSPAERPHLPARFEQPAVLLAHSSDLMLAGLRGALPGTVTLAGQFTTAADLLKALAHRPDGMLVLDDQLTASPLALVKQIRGVSPHLRTLVLSRQLVGLYMEALFHAGAFGFLYMAEPLSDLLGIALDAAVHGRRYLSPLAASQYVLFTLEHGPSAAGQPPLAGDESQALLMLVNGCDVSETARQLGVSTDRVYRLHHRLRIWFGVHTNVDLVRQAVRFGLDG